MSQTVAQIQKQIKELLRTSACKLEDIEQAIALLKNEEKQVKAGATQPQVKSPTSSKKSEEQINKQVREASDEFKAKAIKIFNNADKDGNGTIDPFELHDLLNELLGPVTLPEANAIYREMDTNDSGTITFDEFLTALVAYDWDINTLSSRQIDNNRYEWEIPFEELKLEKKLGEGSYGVVHRAKWRGIDVAVKELKDLTDEEALSDFKKEIAILGKLRHPNVILFMGASTKLSQMSIITEFLEGGSIHDVLHTHNRRFNAKTAIDLAKQTAFGVNYLHLSNILHRDLKPMNLLLDRYNNLKICDFGLSIAKPKTGNLTEKVGTPLWTAPEVLLKRNYDESADVYSYAICFWEMVTGEEPFLDIEDYDQLINEVAHGTKRPTIPSTVPQDLANLIAVCWDRDTKKRPNFATIIAHLERLSRMM